MSSGITLQPRRGTVWGTMQPSVRELLPGLGLAWASAFILIGTLSHLQLYGDGAAFSFAVAIGESWALHWHNIVGRSTVLLCCLLPAETLARWMQDAQTGIAVYGLLFFSTPAIGLAITCICDRSKHRVFFATACISTACLCPLVFGFPTEMWIAHAVFWPALTLAHQAQRGRAGFVWLQVGMLALVFTHEGGAVLALALVATTSIRRSPFLLLRSGGALATALAALVLAHWLVPPDDYFAPALASAGRHFFDLQIFTSGAFALLATVVAGYAMLVVLLRRLGAGLATSIAAGIVLASLGVYWAWFSPALHAENRYCLRTALVVLTPVFAWIAATLGTREDDQRRLPARLTQHLRQLFDRPIIARSAIAAFLLVTLVHAVETVRFVDAWTGYTKSVRALASGTISDPTLGDLQFVSSERIDRPLSALAWSSTTPFLSVLLSAGFAPKRLVTDPAARYFWLSCEFSRAIVAKQALQTAGLSLISRYSCLHR